MGMLLLLNKMRSFDLGAVSADGLDSRAAKLTSAVGSILSKPARADTATAAPVASAVTSAVAVPVAGPVAAPVTADANAAALIALQQQMIRLLSENEQLKKTVAELSKQLEAANNGGGNRAPI